MTLLPVLDLDATRGIAACYFVDSANPADDAPLLDPVGNIGRVLFHSDLAYYEVALDSTVALTLPARTAYDGAVPGMGLGADGYYYLDHAPFPALGLTEVPFALIGVGDVWAMGGTIVQTVYAGTTPSYRLVEASATATGLNIREKWLMNFSYTASAFPTMPAVTIALRGIVFNRRVRDPSRVAFDINPTAGHMEFGGGLIDTAATTRYLTEQASGLAFTMGRTIDLMPGGWREWNIATGAVTTSGTYTGTYAGPAVRRVA